MSRLVQRGGLASALLLTIASTAAGSPIAFGFTGSVTAVRDDHHPWSAPPGWLAAMTQLGVVVGAEVTGHLSYDPEWLSDETSWSCCPGPRASFNGTPDVSFSIGALSWASNRNTGLGFTLVDCPNALTGRCDADSGFLWFWNIGADNAGLLDPSGLKLFVHDVPTPYPAPPELPSTVAGHTGDAFFDVLGEIGDTPGPLDFTIDHIFLVPEPAPVVLLACGLGALSLGRRRPAIRSPEAAQFFCSNEDGPGRIAKGVDSIQAARTQGLRESIIDWARLWGRSSR